MVLRIGLDYLETCGAFVGLIRSKAKSYLMAAKTAMLELNLLGHSYSFLTCMDDELQLYRAYGTRRKSTSWSIALVQDGIQTLFGC